jgi:hypothetical protein
VADWAAINEWPGRENKRTPQPRRGRAKTQGSRTPRVQHVVSTFKSPGVQKIGRPIEDGLNTVAACKSADVRDPFLGLRLGGGSGLCRKLEHRCFLTFEHVSEEHHLPVWKFQRIMMCSRVVFVDLPEDGSRVIDYIRFPAKQPALPTPHLLGKGELRSGKNTNCCPDIFRRGESSSASIEVVGGQFVPNLGGT